jgi:methylated-DNA-[protein]-cysteine S-methyltransferase
MDAIEIISIKAPPGELILGSFGGKLCLCDWKHRKARETIDSRLRKHTGALFREVSSPVTEQAALQLCEYFEGKREIFSIPLQMIGTAFQISVWTELLEIPYGNTATYAGLALRLNKPGAERAVAMANAANALAIMVPCHRIIGSSGHLTGYSGGMAVKASLLRLEGFGAAGQLRMFE